MRARPGVFRLSWQGLFSRRATVAAR
jgi:hypothetical protein